MDWNKLADVLIPDENVKPLDYYEAKYPERDLPKGAQVTRLAPSPTGFIHLGNLFVAIANERIAHQSEGLMYLRIEDTDLKRKVDGAVDAVKNALRYFDIRFDEGAEIEGAENAYGPYYQRERAEIYHAYAKDLIKRGLAYPCFCTEDELSALREKQTAEKKITGYYGEYAACRHLTEEQIYENLKADIGDEALTHPARYALIEVVNIHDEAMKFEPIYRVAFDVDAKELITELEAYLSSLSGDASEQTIEYICSDKSGTLVAKHPVKQLTVGTLQDFLDSYVASHKGASVDYIHGENSVKSLVSDTSVGFIFSGMSKAELFKTVIYDGALPRKTFSMGHAEDKRYYLECRKIK